MWKQKEDCRIVLRRALRESFQSGEKPLFTLPRSRYGSAKNLVMLGEKKIVEATWLLPDRPVASPVFHAMSKMSVFTEELADIRVRDLLYEYLFQALVYKMGVIGRPSWLAITMLQVDEYFFPVPVNASRSIEALKKEFMDAVPTR